MAEGWDREELIRSGWKTYPGYVLAGALALEPPGNYTEAQLDDLISSFLNRVSDGGAVLPPGPNLPGAATSVYVKGDPTTPRIDLTKTSTSDDVIAADGKRRSLGSVVSGDGLSGAPAGYVPVANGDGTYSPSAIGDQGLAKKRRALRHWWAALAGREGLSPASQFGTQMFVIGDSNPEYGGGTDSFYRTAYAGLRDRLRLRYPVPGVTGGPNYIPPFMTVEPPDFPVQDVGGVTFDNGGGPGLKQAYLNAAGEKQIYSARIGQFEIPYTQAPGLGSFKVYVDNDLLTTVNTAGALDYGRRFTSGGPALGDHTVTVEWASGEVYFGGLIAYNGDVGPAGIRMYNFGHGGKQAHDFANAGGGTQAGRRSWSALAATMAPDLVILQLGYNDFYFGRTAAQFRADLATVVDQILYEMSFSGRPTSIVIVGLPERGDASNPADPWSSFINAMGSVADDYDEACFADMSKVIPAPAVDNSSKLYNPDLAHLAPLGGQFFADWMAGFLAPA